jgi:hypothetical protein
VAKLLIPRVLRLAPKSLYLDLLFDFHNISQTPSMNSQ